MRIVAAAILAIGTLASAGGGAKAQEDLPWCAIFSGDLGGVRSCAFSTQQQCLATVSGVGGFCQPNPWYNTPPRSTPRRWR